MQGHTQRAGTTLRSPETYTNARLEGLNGLFRAARARARGYRNVDTFMTMIYMIGSPAGAVRKSTPDYP